MASLTSRFTHCKPPNASLGRRISPTRRQLDRFRTSPDVIVAPYSVLGLGSPVGVQRLQLPKKVQPKMRIRNKVTARHSSLAQ